MNFSILLFIINKTLFACMLIKDIRENVLRQGIALENKKIKLSFLQ